MKNRWPPGFRFHPTDEELVAYYLKRKICKRRLKLDIIRETDVYKWDPEDLPEQSAMKTGDRQWFFFSPRDRKYPNGARASRATRYGYWKATGKDRNITCNNRIVGIKKTLVFYRGRAPTGERTDWVMHEYTLHEDELKRCQNVQDYYALYKVYKKSGPGPKNGEQYGAPFREEDWADEEQTDIDNLNEEIASIQHNDVSSVEHIGVGGIQREITTVHNKVLSSVDDVGVDSIRREINIQHNEVSSVNDVQAHENVQSPFSDIEDILKNIANDPLPDNPKISCSTYSLPQVDVEGGSHSTMVNTSVWELSNLDPIKGFIQADQQCYEQTSFDFRHTADSQCAFHEASEVTSAPSNLEQEFYLPDEDFLEMDDLIGPDPDPSLTGTKKCADDLTVEDYDGLSEFDLYHDAAMFLNDIGTVDQAAALNPYMNTLENDLLSQLNYQLPPQSANIDQNGSLYSVHDQNNGVSNCTGVAYESTSSWNNKNQDTSHKDGSRGSTSLSSALWAFVDSIPANPASAAESAFVNRAFERMSSFGRLRLSSINSNTDAAGSCGGATAKKTGRSRGIYVCSVIGALCAVSWVLMGSVSFWGKGIS